MKSDNLNQKSKFSIERLILLIAAGLIIVSALLVFALQRREMAKNAPTQLTFLPQEDPQQSPDRSAQVLSNSTNSPANNPSPSSATQRTLPPSRAAAASLAVPTIAAATSVQLQSTKYGTMVPITVKFRKLCGGVDLQRIRADAERYSISSLLLTIEPLVSSRSSKPLVVQDIPVEQLLLGPTLNLTVPDFDTPQHLGVFLCSDPTGRGACKGNKAATLHAGSRSIGVIYYFGYLLLDGKFVSAPDPQLVRELPPRRLKDWLRGDPSIPKNALPTQVLELIRTVEDKLRPLPLDLSSPIVGVALADCQNR